MKWHRHIKKEKFSECFQAVRSGTWCPHPKARFFVWLQQIGQVCMQDRSSALQHEVKTFMLHHCLYSLTISTLMFHCLYYNNNTETYLWITYVTVLSRRRWLLRRWCVASGFGRFYSWPSRVFQPTVPRWRQHWPVQKSSSFPAQETCKNKLDDYLQW